MPNTHYDAPADYRAALDSAVIVDEATHGRMFLRGRDRAELLHRLSTNHITRLNPGDGTRTVLTTPIGRIIDLLNVYALQDELLITTSADQGASVFSHLKKNIFFNDQVSVHAAGRSHAQWALYGPAAQSIIAQLAGEPLDDLGMNGVRTITVAGVPVLVARRLPIGGQGFTLLVPAEQAAAVRAAVDGAGVLPLSAESFDILRVEQGYAVWGRELSQAYIPLETGLLDAISFNKGCYVGQEIIARMESRGRLAKQLRGLHLSGEIQELRADSGSNASQSPGLVAQSSLKLHIADKEAGDVTSVVVSPRFGPIALAYVRTAHAEPGTLAGIAEGTAQATVVELPFAL